MHSSRLAEDGFEIDSTEKNGEYMSVWQESKYEKTLAENAELRARNVKLADKLDAAMQENARLRATIQRLSHFGN